jgi:ribonuclease HI
MAPSFSGAWGASVVLTSPKGDKLQYMLQMNFRASNNVAEYEALVHGLKMAKQIGIWRILCFGDSDLVVHQVSGDWDARDANMASYRFYLQQLSGFFEGCEFHHVPRANNDEADRLSKMGSTKEDIPAGVSLEIIHKPSIKPSPDSPSIYVPRDPAPAQVPPTDLGAAASGLKEAAGQPSVAGSMKDTGAAGSTPAPPAGQSDKAGTTTDPGAADPLVASVFHIREIPSWAEPFSNYLITGDLPQDKVEARRIQRRVGAYTIINSELYKRSVLGIFQKCIEPEEGIELLREIHQGGCGHHASSRALVAKTFRHGFYWPTAKQNAEQLVK